jgi:dTDP-4-dehydrorhamnose 3,5-epimerase
VTPSASGPDAEVTAIPGVIVVDIPIVPDARGWSTTSFDVDSMELLGLPASFTVAQWRSNFNRYAGVTRGIHAELCDKFVTLSSGTIWTAIVDLRAGETFGRVVTMELTPGRALFIPVGCGNSYQTQTDGVGYGYVCDRNIAPGVPYTGVALDDPDLAIPWPRPLTESILLEPDRHQPRLSEIRPIDIHRLRHVAHPNARATEEP